jgi:hypothetical protein
MNPRNNWSPVNSEPISLADYQQAQRAKQRQQTQSFASVSVTNNNARMKPIARPSAVSQAPSPPPSSKPNYNSNNNNRSSEESSNYRPGNNKKIVKSSSREKATIKKESKPVYVEKEKTPKVVYVKKQQLQPNS